MTLLAHIVSRWLELAVIGGALWNALLWYGERRAARRWSDLAPGYKPTLKLVKSVRSDARRQA